MTFGSRASALVVVDVQRYFSRPGYPFAHVLEKLVPGVTTGYFDEFESGVLDNIGLGFYLAAHPCSRSATRALPASGWRRSPGEAEAWVLVVSGNAGSDRLMLSG